MCQCDKEEQFLHANDELMVQENVIVMVVYSMVPYYAHKVPNMN